MAGEEGAAVADQEPAPAAASEPAAAAPGAGAPEPESYTKDQVSAIVQERLKGWQRYGKPEELEARLARAEKLEAWAGQMRQSLGQPGLPGQGAPTGAPPLSEEDKKVQAYMEKLYPGISKFNEQVRTFQTSLSELNGQQWMAISESNNTKLSDLASKAGYKAEQVAEIANRVAQSIAGNREDYAAYIKGRGDFEIVKKHFEGLDKFLKGFSAAPPATAAAQYVKDKTKTQNLPPRLPAAGVPAPTSSQKPLNKDERVKAAWERYKAA